MLPLKKASRDLLLPMLEHHAPHLVAQAFNPDIQTYTRDFYTKLQCAVADEFHARGLREDYEPNEYGLECEALIDELGWLAEGWTTGSFEEFERDVISWIAKETPQYEQQILSQYNSCRIKSRRFTGHGFFTDFEVADTSDSLGDFNETLGALGLDINRLRHGTGYILFVKDGLITCLEGYAYDEPVPEDIFRYKWTDSYRKYIEKNNYNVNQPHP